MKEEETAGPKIGKPKPYKGIQIPVNKSKPFANKIP